jgi:hypothetical protein
VAQRDADGQRRLMVVGNGAQRAADARPLKEDGKNGDETSGNRGPESNSLIRMPPGLSRSNRINGSFRMPRSSV